VDGKGGIKAVLLGKNPILAVEAQRATSYSVLFKALIY